jgi:uncharacterized protein (TIGR03382 family)
MIKIFCDFRQFSAKKITFFLKLCCDSKTPFFRRFFCENILKNRNVGSRSVRDSSIGIATISSITVGVIALLCFGLLIFLALARRRRLRRQGTSSLGSPMVTPTQSRTTFSGSPIVDTPSLSDTRAASYLDDPINTSSSAGSSLDPVLPLDGHGTIVTSYDDYMSLPETARGNILSSLAGSGSGLGSAAGPSPPPPPLPASESVPRTRNLAESSDFLFSRSPPPFNPYPV